MPDERVFSWVDERTNEAKIVRIAAMRDVKYKFQNGQCIEVRFSLNGSGDTQPDCEFAVKGRNALLLHDTRRNMLVRKYAYLGPCELTKDEWVELEITTTPVERRSIPRPRFYGGPLRALGCDSSE